MITEFRITKVADNNYKATMHYGEKLEGTIFEDKHFSDLTLDELKTKVEEFTTTTLMESDIKSLDEMPLVLFGW
jgi:hypothetical protein